MDFAWSKNQKDLKEAAVKFAESKLNDKLIEKEERGEFSYQGWKACADFGLQGMLIPKAYGGMELNPLDMVAVLEGIGYGCRDSGLLFSINAHIWACELPIYHFGTEEQKQKYLPKLCQGESIGANAMTEPDSGSDVYGLRTTATEEKDGFVLNGSKMFITNAPVANLFIVYARSGASKGFAGISCFLVEKGAEGLMVGKEFKKMGLRTSPMSDVAFQQCRVPKDNVIGKIGSGAIIFSDSMEWERTFILSYCIGAMERQWEACLKYTKLRKTGEKPIGKQQAVANKIVEMRVRLETSRLILYKAAWLKNIKKSAVTDSAIAKLYVSEAYVQNMRDAIQIFGGYGYMVEYGLERDLRDALASTIYSGTSEIQKNIIGAFSGL